MRKLKIKEQFYIDGLKVVNYDQAGTARAVTYKAGKLKFHVAQDSFGTQICKDGYFFPDRKSLGTLEQGVEYLRAHTQEAIEFFKHPVDNKLTFSDVMFAVVTNGETLNNH